MKEKDMQTLFGRKNQVRGVFELKLVKRKTLPYSKVEKHQISALLKVAGEGLSYKLSDMSMDKKPFDCFRLAKTPAYIVPIFYEPRKKKIAYYIPIHVFVERVGPGESMNEEMAQECADHVVEL